MMKHVVCFKLKEPSEELLLKTREILLSMRGNVPTAKNVEVGIDFLHSARSYDIILVVTLADPADLDVYQNDEYHCSVVKKHMHAIAETSVALDYLID